MSNNGGNNGSGNDGQMRGVPTWGGEPHKWQSFVSEVNWFIKSLKIEDRILAAPRIVLKLLQSHNASVRRLAMKLNPDEFTDAKSVQRLLDALNASPLGQLPLPDAGNKIGGYYKKLHRRKSESVGDFLLREDNTWESMWQALERLLLEKDFDWDQDEVTIDELKRFANVTDDDHVKEQQKKHWRWDDDKGWEGRVQEEVALLLRVYPGRCQADVAQDAEKG